MDVLTPVALIAFLAQVLIWFGLPEGSRVEMAAASTTSAAEPEAMAA